MDSAPSGFVAVDLGASSGRVILGRFDEESFELDELHRFPNEMTRVDGALRWSTRDLFAEIKRGLAKAAAADVPVRSVAVDTWGVDYGLLDGSGRLIEEPIAYRDARTAGIFEKAFAIVPRAEIYRATGVQLMPINTLFQLHAHVHGGSWPTNVARLLTMPDLFHHLLCGSDVGEWTHATTTQMVRHDSREWDRDLLRRLGIPSSILPRLVTPGTKLGPLTAEVARETGLAGCEVVAAGSHDTASAVAGTPLSDGVAYVSSGTWSLVGVELAQPLVNEETERENFTNEGGVGSGTLDAAGEGGAGGGGLGTSIRFLKNVTGMWILEQCRKAWKEQGKELSWEELDRAVERAPAWGGVIAPDDPLFFNPADMVAAVQRFLRETQQPAPTDPGAVARIVLESLALRYADVLAAIARLTGRPLAAVRILGGGSRHDFLNQATAEVSGLEVLAGPVEATAIGNLLVQAIVAGRFRDLAEARARVAHVLPALKYRPRDRAGAPALVERLRRVRAVRERAAPRR
jgi:rhamnulokinase